MVPLIDDFDEMRDLLASGARVEPFMSLGVFGR
jgi:hypothetical protein